MPFFIAGVFWQLLLVAVLLLLVATLLLLLLLLFQIATLLVLSAAIVCVCSAECRDTGHHPSRRTFCKGFEPRVWWPFRCT